MLVGFLGLLCLANAQDLFLERRKVVQQNGYNEEMRSDDLVSDDKAARIPCVDCPEYVKLSAKDKQQALWQNIISDEYAGDFPKDFPGLLTVNFRDLRQVAWNGTMPMFFDRFSDENPTEHAKVIHTFGSTAGVRLEPVANSLGLTGVFQEGAEHAVLRLSIVADWTQPCKGGIDINFKGCLKPSLAFKALRDGDFSSNTVAQVNLGEGVGRDFNFFDHAQATWLPAPTGIAAELVEELFSYASQKEETSGVGLQELASQGAKADQEPNEIKAPQLIYFVPAEQVKANFTSQEHDPRVDFQKIPVGTHLYDVVAVMDDPACFSNGSPVYYQDLKGCPLTTVGRIVTTSRFVASAWEDRRLFFQHERLKTKSGPWKRQACASKSSLLASDAYRMANNWGQTCTQSCHDPDMTKIDAPCPFAKLR